jgi:hypothetical protein
MRLLVKIAASTVGILCTTASAYLLVDENKRYGVVFAATISQPPADNSNDLIKPDQRSLSSPIQSNEPWNWNWDGLVSIRFGFSDCFFFVLLDSRHSEMNKTRAVRHVYLIRHGQYLTRTKFEDQKQLTELGVYHKQIKINRSVVVFSYWIFR